MITSRPRPNGWTGAQWSLVRGALGIYLAIHFASLIPWGAELFSSVGAIPTASHSPLLRAFPNVFALVDAPGFITATLCAAIVSSVAFAVGYKTRWVAIFTWYIWACLLGRNPLIINPGIPYIGWILLLFAALPDAPNLSLDARGQDDPARAWELPRPLWATAWIVMVVGYSYSGWMKLSSPSWIDGSSIQHVLSSPLARPTFLREWLLQWPSLLQALTWSTLALELFAAPIALWSRARPHLWLALVGLHLGIIATVDFADLTIGMLMIHLVTFDPAWIPGKHADAAPDVIIFDGACGLCHGFIRFVLGEDSDHDNPRFLFRDGGEELARVRLERGDQILEGAPAVAAVLERLGGIWRPLGVLVRLTPAALSSRAYDAIARKRRAIVAAPDACPIPPAYWRQRYAPE